MSSPTTQWSQLAAFAARQRQRMAGRASRLLAAAASLGLRVLGFGGSGLRGSLESPFKGSIRATMSATRRAFM